MTTKTYLKRALIFFAVGIVIYAGLYAVAEALVYKNTSSNRFYMIKTRPATTFDLIVMGASHAMAMSFEDLNEQLEKMTGSRIMNISMLGNGIVPNQLILDYFDKKHKAKNAVYLLDSAMFYSGQFNESRLKDVRLFQRAPFDFQLINLLVSYGFKGSMTVGTIADYILGFSKINNGDRFNEDIHPLEKMCRQTYRPRQKQIKDRVDSNMPATFQEEALKEYLDLFIEMIDSLRSQGVHVIVVKPPLPKPFYDMLPFEAKFDKIIEKLMAEKNIPYKDFSTVIPDYKFYFDTDHLNRKGVILFFNNYFTQFLKKNIKS